MAKRESTSIELHQCNSSRFSQWTTWASDNPAKNKRNREERGRRKEATQPKKSNQSSGSVAGRTQRGKVPTTGGMWMSVSSVGLIMYWSVIHIFNCCNPTPLPLLSHSAYIQVQELPPSTVHTVLRTTSTISREDSTNNDKTIKSCRRKHRNVDRRFNPLVGILAVVQAKASGLVKVDIPLTGSNLIDW